MHLGSEDTAWLHMEDPTNPMVVDALVELGTRVELGRLRAVVEARGLPPRFRSRVVEQRRPPALPRLEIDPSFDLDRHLLHVEIEPGDEALQAFVSREVGTPLDRTRPLWKTFVIDREGAPTAILFRVHHALADGFALLGRLLSLCDEHARGAPVIATHGTRAAGWLRQGVTLARLVALPRDPRTTFKNELGSEKNVAWSRPVSLDLVKSIARGAGGTVNDVLVSAVAGALSRYLARHGERVENVRAMVPVNLRTEADGELGNRFGLVVLSLPVGALDAGARLAAVKRRMDRIKSTPEAYVAKDLLGAMGHLPVRLETLGAAFFAKKASLVLTNVPGPRETLHLAGAPIERVMFWVPEAARLGLGVSIFSYAGSVTVGVVADARVVSRPGEIIDALHAEIDALAARDAGRRAS